MIHPKLVLRYSCVVAVITGFIGSGFSLANSFADLGVASGMLIGSGIMGFVTTLVFD